MSTSPAERPRSSRSLWRAWGARRRAGRQGASAELDTGLEGSQGPFHHRRQGPQAVRGHARRSQRQVPVCRARGALGLPIVPRGPHIPMRDQAATLHSRARRILSMKKHSWPWLTRTTARLPGRSAGLAPRGCARGVTVGRPAGAEARRPASAAAALRALAEQAAHLGQPGIGVGVGGCWQASSSCARSSGAATRAVVVAAGGEATARATAVLAEPEHGARGCDSARRDRADRTPDVPRARTSGAGAAGAAPPGARRRRSRVAFARVGLASESLQIRPGYC